MRRTETCCDRCGRVIDKNEERLAVATDYCEHGRERFHERRGLDIDLCMNCARVVMKTILFAYTDGTDPLIKHSKEKELELIDDAVRGLA